MRNWILAGAGGLVGNALKLELSRRGERVRVLVRHSPRNQDEIFWDPKNGILNEAEIAEADVVVCLSGATIAQRWSSSNKTDIVESRIDTTQLLAKAVASQSKPIHFLHASATGFYGPCDDNVQTEQSPPGQGFLAQTAIAWENAADAARILPHSVTSLRFGVILAANGGAFEKMRLPFSLGLGGPIGTGKQWFPWIHIQDVVQGILHCVEQKLTGPILFTAPEAVRQIDFAHALGHSLQRPAFMPLPSFAVSLLFGQMGEEVLLAGQRCAPHVLETSGYPWRYANLKSCLENLVATP